MRFMEKFVNVGTVLLQNTCDEIAMDLDGNSRRINTHVEHWLVEDVRKEGFYLYNLDTKRKRVLSRGDLNIALASQLFTISDEVA